MNKKFLLFKPDGVLVDSVEVRKNRIYSLLIRLNLYPDKLGATRSEDFESIMVSNWGKSKEDLFSLLCSLLGGGNLEYRSLLEAEENYITEYPTVSNKLVATISKLKEEHGLGILTSRKTLDLFRLAKKTGLDLLPFDLVQTADNSQFESFTRKVFIPSLAWVKELSIPEQNIYYFGNTVRYDYLLTLNTKINFIGVCSGASTEEDFIQRGLSPERIVSFGDLPDYLEKSFIKKEPCCVL